MRVHSIVPFCLFLFLISFLQGCRPDQGPLLPTGIVELNFKVVYDGQPVVFEKGEYDYENGAKIRFGQFNFYLSNIILETAGTSDQTDVFDVKLLSFSDTTLILASNGRTLASSGIPIGDYSAIRFDLGVSPDLNTSKGFPEGRYFGQHPLNHPELYSEALGSYIFMNLEGAWNVNSDLFRLRPGTNALYKEGIEFQHTILVQEVNKTRLDFVIDLKRVMAKGPGMLDLNTEFQTTPENMETLGQLLMDNLGDAMTLE